MPHRQLTWAGSTRSFWCLLGCIGGGEGGSDGDASIKCPSASVCPPTSALRHAEMWSGPPGRMGLADECGVNSTLSFSAWPSLVDEDRISNALPFSSTARVTSKYVSGCGGSAGGSLFSSDRQPSPERGTSSAAAMSRPE
eukprot:3427417-Pleurochrysis_carterae.AAC.1